MEKKALLRLVFVLSIGLIAPTLAFATGFADNPIVPDVAGPAILLGFGILSLLGAVVCYVLRLVRREGKEVNG